MKSKLRESNAMALAIALHPGYGFGLLSYGLANNWRHSLSARSLKLYADIVMSLGDIFGYISSKTGRILTKLLRGMGNGERVIL